MPSFQAVVTRTILKLQPYRWAEGTIEQQRLWQENSTKLLGIPKGIKIDQVANTEFKGEWISSIESKKGIILYLHGGAFSLGSVNSHREFLSRLAITTKRSILAVNYRLAPENPFPAALEDSLSAYRWLLSQGIKSQEIAIAGDSAGGGLACSTLISLRNNGDPLPACAVLISPWLDLTLSGQSMDQNAKIDPILNPELLKKYAQLYANNHDPKDPFISPIFADLRNLPAVLIHTGGFEILLSDATRFLENASKAGSLVRLETWEGLFHVFQIVPYLPESRESLLKISSFLSEYFLEQ